MRTKFVFLAALLVPLLAGCGLKMPSDPEGTLDRVAGGTLRVGISHNPPWTETGTGSGPANANANAATGTSSAGTGPAGTEAELVRAFAAEHNARVEWVSGGESNLVRRLERGELDLVVGGLTKDSPWSKHAALTQPYLETSNGQGDKEQHVMAARMGENAFLVELERFLREEVQ
ncbi:transporter substrate-binding domain-containing protein [Arthrobacter mangrovi]|uniref:ABC transporter substrate-binding protein n=1 Tax=Arthrobacter mangrovi TaxID=2966350 RepID=A0ABQ5MXE1_9MICC|nr:transporter substrate-binding domain-containing protein [Arthrobacter mangrovi]GLB68628.1 ABC transporter substrate-binding protein [Arthrobacter mangrovi]